MDSFHNDAVAMALSIRYATFDDAAVDDFYVDRTSLDDTSIDCQSAQAHAPSGNTCPPKAISLMACSTMCSATTPHHDYTYVESGSLQVNTVVNTSLESSFLNVSNVEDTSDEDTSMGSLHNKNAPVSNHGADTRMSRTHAAEFVETLKETDVRTFGHGTLKQTGLLVVGLDSSRFIQYCDKASPDYNPNYCNYNEISRHLFQADEVWISRELLLKAMDLVAKYHGFTIRLDKEYIKCYRQGTDKTKRAYVNGPLNAGCTFQFKLVSLETERYMPADSTKKKWRYKKRWDRPIKIIDGCCTHGSACQPSKQNRVNTSQQARKYMNNMPKSAIFTLCNYMENLGRLESNLITNVMKPVWPRAKEFSKYDVFNIRVKVMRLLHV
jgi:hypothetical protein